MMDQQTPLPENYYTQKYSLTATHSEVLEAAKLIAPGKTLIWAVAAAAMRCIST